MDDEFRLLQERVKDLSDKLHRLDTEGVRSKSLGFLTGSHWSLIRLAEAQKELLPVLRSLDDDKLMEAFYTVFIADYKLKRIESNYFRLTWDEYQDEAAQQGYVGIPVGHYDGDELIDFMLNRFESPGHFCLLYNVYMERPQSKAIFPQADRDVFIQCVFRGVG